MKNKKFTKKKAPEKERSRSAEKIFSFSDDGSNCRLMEKSQPPGGLSLKGADQAGKSAGNFLNSNFMLFEGLSELGQNL